MGMIRSSLSFIIGVAFGIYLAQNYNVPNVKKLVSTGLIIARSVEESNRKPKKRSSDDEDDH